MLYGSRIPEVILMLLFVSACADDSGVSITASMDETETALLVTRPVRGDRPVEDRQWFVADRVPEFGGMRLSNDTVHVMLTDLSARERAEGAIRALLMAPGGDPRQGGPTHPSIVVHQGSHSFADLSEWRERLTLSIFSIDGVISVAIDYHNNAILVGVRDDDVVAEVERFLGRIQVPSSAVRFRRDEVRLHVGATSSATWTGTTLKSQFRPLRGGIVLPRLGDETGSGCTLSFGALWENREVFLTASHCSSIFWSTDNQQYFQHLPIGSAEYYVGIEYYDPRGSSCSVFYKCRWSDASIVLPASGVAIKRGAIARPSGFGSIVIDPANPEFTIGSSYQWPLQNWNVRMVGHASGLTQGQIINDCVDVSHNWQIRKCQVVASYPSANGDSGAPVFSPANEGRVTLYGLHWGHAGGGSVFSPIGGIVRDLGSMFVSVPLTSDPGEPGGPGGCSEPSDPNGMIEPC